MTKPDHPGRRSAGGAPVAVDSFVCPAADVVRTAAAGTLCEGRRPGMLRCAVRTPRSPSSDLAARPRSRAADRVFDGLLGVIARGEVAPGAELPAEREVAEQFGVSVPIVRQAMHRLDRAGVVRVRQGRPSTALDPCDTDDPRVMLAVLEHAPPDSGPARELREVVIVEALSVVALAAARAGPDERAALDVAQAAVDAATDVEAFAVAEVELWRVLGRATNNRLLRRRVEGWLASPGVRRVAAALGDPVERASLYRELNARLRAGEDAAEPFREAVRRIARRDAGA